ncbi:MAG: class II glutamine amidotransferase, partial [Bradymonadaceae bacterium]
MSQLFGYLSSNDMLTQAVMAQVGHELQAVPLQDRSGLGLGWIQDGRSLLRKHPPKRAATADVASLVTDLPARAIVGHVRHASLGAVTSNELQPFRFRTWLYAQGGLNEGLENLARTFRKEI